MRIFYARFRATSQQPLKLGIATTNPVILYKSRRSQRKNHPLPPRHHWVKKHLETFVLSITILSTPPTPSITCRKELHQPTIHSTQATLAMDNALATIQHYATNIHRNITGAFDDMDAKRWIRLVAVIGGYFLLRPYLVKLGEKLSNKQYAKTMEDAQMTGPKAKISPNALRGYVEPIEEEGEGEVAGKEVEGDKKVRKRQAKKVNFEQQEEANQADLMDQLVDYVEGEDGW